MTSEIEPDVDMINEQAFDKILDDVLEQDKKGELEGDIQLVSKTYGLHEDDDRDEILFFIAEMIYKYEEYLLKENL